MIRYRVKNWKKYQHYSKRNPPWVKLHFELLSSADWVSLADSSRVLAVVSMLLASRNDGYVPSDPDYLKRVAYLNTDPDFTELLKCGFLECVNDSESDASKTLADVSVSVSASASVSVSVSEGVQGVSHSPPINETGIEFQGLPPELDNQVFRSAWLLYEAHRRTTNKGCVNLLERVQNFVQLAAIGPYRAAEVCRLAVGNGWSKLVFDAKELSKPSGPTKCNALELEKLKIAEAARNPSPPGYLAEQRKKAMAQARRTA